MCNNGFNGGSIWWIILVLILLCGCGNNGGICGNHGSICGGCDNGCGCC